jgi:hypothetical protein
MKLGKPPLPGNARAVQRMSQMNAPLSYARMRRRSASTLTAA